ncbi:MAG: hypothetical protein NT013_25320 [Planctomycetia bacterium]|nr:hypothetical protein [Planctomycetia bacterium]
MIHNDSLEKFREACSCHSPTRYHGQRLCEHRETKTGDVIYYKVSLQRTYKDGNEFKTTTNFSRDDLSIV